MGYLTIVTFSFHSLLKEEFEVVLNCTVDALGGIQLPQHRRLVLFEKPWGSSDICLGLADTGGDLLRHLLSQRPYLDFSNGARHLCLVS